MLMLLLALAYGIHYAWYAFPIISGFSAKNACSCAFIQGRSKASIMKEELGSFPLSLGSIEINNNDASVTGTVLGFAKRKAIYRPGLGCTLINDFAESEVRAQKFLVPEPSLMADTSAWITGLAAVDTAEHRFDSSRLIHAIEFAFNHHFADKEVHTRAMVVVQHGKIIGEKYAPGYDVNSRFLGWSMAKSVTSSLIGILVKDGKLQVSQPAPIPKWHDGNDKRKSITVEHLLQQTSGLDFVEDYGGYSNVTNMLFNRGNMADYMEKLPLKQQPGTAFYYSSGNSNLLSGIIKRLLPTQQYHAFPYQRLFHKIGMHHTLMEPDASGTYIGSSYIYASARDYARFGWLYANDGMWNEERILPEGWVRQTVTPPAANKLKNYGYQFWLNGLDPEDASKREFPAAPSDMFYADGYGGQRIYIMPTQKLVIVRMGLNKFDEQQFLHKLMQAINQ